MTLDIAVRGVPYELQISARRLLNDGRTAVGPLDDEETERIWEAVQEGIATEATWNC